MVDPLVLRDSMSWQGVTEPSGSRTHGAAKCDAEIRRGREAKGGCYVGDADVGRQQSAGMLYLPGRNEGPDRGSAARTKAARELANGHTTQGRELRQRGGLSGL